VIIFAVGVLVLIAGILKLLPGAAGAGGAFAFLGVLLFGLSFIPKPEASADAEPPLTPFERTAGMFYEPTRVFQNLRSHPRWLVAILIVSLVSVIYSTAFIQRVTPERIAEQAAKGVREFEEHGWVPAGTADKSRDAVVAEAKNPIKRVGDAVSTVVWRIVGVAVLAVLYLLIVLMFGGRINFWQSMAATAHAALPVTVLQKLLSLVILYIKSPDDVHPLLGQESLVTDNLGYFFLPADHPVLFVLASTIGLLSFYRLWLTATGLKNSGQKVSSSAAWAAALGILLLGVLFSAVIAALFPGFLS